MKERYFVSLYLNKDMAELLKKGIRETGKNTNEFVREALKEKFQRMGLTK